MKWRRPELIFIGLISTKRLGYCQCWFTSLKISREERLREAHPKYFKYQEDSFFVVQINRFDTGWILLMDGLLFGMGNLRKDVGGRGIYPKARSVRNLYRMKSNKTCLYIWRWGLRYSSWQNTDRWTDGVREKLVYRDAESQRPGYLAP